MSDKDYIKELFSEKLGNYEAKVNPELWNSIASSIGTSTATTGISIVTKWIIGVAVVGAAAITAVVISTSPTDERVKTVTENKVEESNKNSIEEKVLEQENKVPTNEVIIPTQTTTQNRTLIHQPGNNVGPLQILDFRDTNPILMDKQQIIVDEPIIQEMKQRTPVHTQDPVVHEPMMPEEILAEEHHEVNNDFYVGKLPNVFTPNGDGMNDRFSIETRNLNDFYIVVINDKNNIVFESNDPDFSWDGRDQTGNYVPEGNYVYYITAKEFGTEKPKRFSPLLIKR